MIDLKTKGAPNAIEVYGRTFLLNTDYRVWIDFPSKIKAVTNGDYEGYRTFFLDEENVPVVTEETIRQLGAFFYQKPVVPRDTRKKELVDYDIDADMIYAAFMQAYGIDLVDSDLHWHKFLALMNSIPEGTVLSSVIGYRAYEGKDKDLKELRYKWSLPTKYTEEEQEAIDEFNKYFG